MNAMGRMSSMTLKHNHEYKSAVADGLSHEDAAIHANRRRSDESYERLYDRAITCGASHAQAALYADKIICARSKAFEADWNPDQQIALYHEICARLERIERALPSQ
jgi:hypothetical protein